MPARINRSGITYGSWKAIKPAGLTRGRLVWQCVCVACGITKRVIAGDILDAVPANYLVDVIAERLSRSARTSRVTPSVG